MNTKICSKCGKEKALTEFNKSKQKKDGLGYWCKNCKKNAAIIYYQKNKDVMNIKKKVYYQKNKKNILKKSKEYNKRYRMKNMEKIKEYKEIYRKENQIKISLYRKNYREDNIEKERSLLKAYRLTEKGKISMAKDSFCRRTNYKNYFADLTVEQWGEIKKFQKNKCVYCGKETSLTIDHIIPISKGGNHTRGNVQGLCKSCNSRKSNKIDTAAFQLILGGI